MLTDESSLPRHILINSVLSYLDLHTLVKFSSSSRECQKLVFQEVPKTSWREIHLSGNQITDDQLYVFLKNINAKENTRILSLVGCLNIKGPGLEPLNGSKVLENLDLRVHGSLPLQGELGTLHGPSGLMEDCIARILFSMLPLQNEQAAWLKEGRQIALRRVAIRPLKSLSSIWRFSNYSPIIRGFFLYHDSLKRALPPVDPWKCTPTSCSLCFVQTCPSEEILCSTCNKFYCKSCAIPPKCSECSKRKCQWCSNVVKCAGCDKQSCANHGYECCGGCDKAFCFDCHVDELEFCFVCNEYYCTVECHRHAH